MKDMKNRCYRFDNVEIDVQNLRVTVGSDIRPVEPKSFRLLLFLAENPGRVLPKDEIMATVWPDAFVSDNSLARAITQIRKALDDDPKSPRYIETVPTVGYRFIGELKGERNAAETLDAIPVPVRNRTRWPAVAITAALAIGLVIGAWLFIAHKAHALTAKDIVVLADFANSTGDSVFDDALKQGLAVQLNQSPLLNILPEQKVRSALKEMMRAPDEALTASLAQEVCVRRGSKAYIAGSIANLGGHYVIGLNAIHCTSGDVLAREQTEAANKQQVLAALGIAAERLRNELGESLSSVRKYDVPLAQATTPSLEALKAYSFGLDRFGRGDPAGSVPLFRQAIHLDPDFALAYANLGRAYQNLGQQEPMDGALRKAFALRNRESDREKFDISSVYYQFITDQTDQSIENCELWAQIYPLDFTPHRILGYENGEIGQLDRSLAEFGKAKDLDPGQAIPYAGLMLDYMALNRFPEARSVFAEAQTRKVDLSGIYRYRYLLAFLEGDKETMAKADIARAGEPGYKGLVGESNSEAWFGHLKRSGQLARQIAGTASNEGDKATAAGLNATAAYLEALFGDSAGANRHAAAALSLGAKPTPELALAGDLALATNVVSLLSESAPDSLISRVSLPESRAAVELKRGNPAGAIEFLAPVAPYEMGWYDRLLAAYLRGEAYLAAQRGPEAVAEFQKILSHPGVVLQYPHGALARLGLARAYALEGDSAKARAAYRDFLLLWKDADLDIPVLIAAKSEYSRLQ